MEEEDRGFPSGPWTGFFTQSGFHRMHLQLTFSHGRITGRGTDKVGEFVLQGGYDRETRHCFWRKTYLGRHGVDYRGVQAGKTISGHWTIGGFDSGAFTIWPGGESALSEEFFLEEPAELKEMLVGAAGARGSLG